MGTKKQLTYAGRSGESVIDYVIKGEKSREKIRR